MFLWELVIWEVFFVDFFNMEIGMKVVLEGFWFIILLGIFFYVCKFMKICMNEDFVK